VKWQMLITLGLSSASLFAGFKLALQLCLDMYRHIFWLDVQSCQWDLDSLAPSFGIGAWGW